MADLGLGELKENVMSELVLMDARLKDEEGYINVPEAAETTILTALSLAALWKAPQVLRKIGYYSIDDMKKPLFTGS